MLAQLLAWQDRIRRLESREGKVLQFELQAQSKITRPGFVIDYDVKEQRYRLTVLGEANATVRASLKRLCDECGIRLSWLRLDVTVRP